MKKAIFSLIIFALVAMVSCSKNPIDTEDFSRFEKIYLKQAASYPNSYRMDISDEVREISLNVSIGGNAGAKTDIQVQIDIMPELVQEYNEKNGTEYQLMPAGSFQLNNKQATIMKGEANSNPLTLIVQTSGYIEPGNSYLLPVGIKSIDAEVPVNEKLKVIYYLFSGSYLLGEEPPTQSFDMAGRSLISLFTFKSFLVIAEANGLVNLHARDPLTNTFKNTSAGTNGGWNIFNTVLPSSTGFIARWAVDGRLWEYSVDNAGNLAGDFKDKGTGFNAYDIMTFSDFHNSLFCRKPDGELFRVELVAGAWSKTTSLGNSWDKYTTITAYGEGLLAIDYMGGLWYFPVSANSEPGEKQHIGEGWNIYSRILPFGSNLLALKGGNQLMEYNFDIRGYWKVK